MRIYLLLLLISLWEIASVVGLLPHEISIDSQDIVERLREDAADYCDKKCHANPDDCERDPDRRSLERCIASLYWVYHFNYQVCAEDCRASCHGSLDGCDCRNYCAQIASTVIRRTSKPPKELIETWDQVRSHPYDSEYRSRNGRYNYIGD